MFYYLMLQQVLSSCFEASHYAPCNWFRFGTRKWLVWLWQLVFFWPRDVQLTSNWCTRLFKLSNWLAISWVCLSLTGSCYWNVETGNRKLVWQWPCDACMTGILRLKGCPAKLGIVYQDNYNWIINAMQVNFALTDDFSVVLSIASRWAY